MIHETEAEKPATLNHLEMARLENERLASSTSPPDRFIFWTLHPKTPFMADLSVFAFGKASARIKSATWKGGYSGRAELIEELMPHIRLHYACASQLTITNLKAALVKWWRVFDQAEKHESLAAMTKVTRCSDANELHAAIARKAGIKGQAHGTFLRLLNLRLEEQGLKPRFWPTPEDETQDSDVPEYWEIERIRHALKRRWFGALDRWSDADRLASEGVALTGRNFDAACGVKPVLPRDGHTTYRALLQALQKDVAGRATLNEYIGQIRSELLDPLGPLVHGLYPSKQDIQAAFHLFLLYSGWNVQTLLDLELSDDVIEPHPMAVGYHVVRAIKARGNSEQTVIGRDKRTDSPGSVLRAVIARTAPLRASLHRELIATNAAYRDAPSSELLKKKLRLEMAVKSPWLYVDGHLLDEVRALTTTSHAQGNKQGTTFLGVLIEEINVKATDGRIVKSVTAGDFRDSYIGFAYEFSNYNLLVAQAAAGHKSPETSVQYLRHRQWRAASAGLVRKVGNAFWDELDRTGIVDPAILHALVMRGSISEEQRTRWMMHKDRTRIGTGCIDVRSPPPEIDPQHTGDAPCRIQRCSLCSHAVLLEDSFDHLARRLAELEEIHARIPLATWQQTSFEREKANTSRDLKLYDPKIAQRSLEHWRREIAEGRHVPVDQEGAYE